MMVTNQYLAGIRSSWKDGALQLKPCSVIVEDVGLHALRNFQVIVCEQVWGLRIWFRQEVGSAYLLKLFVDCSLYLVHRIEAVPVEALFSPPPPQFWRSGGFLQRQGVAAPLENITLQYSWVAQLL